MGALGTGNQEIYGKEKKSVWRQDYSENFICGKIEV